MKIGVVACRIMERELDKVLSRIEDIAEVIYLEEGKHVYPEKLKESVVQQINEIKDRVDVIFLGYGDCQSLKGIEDEFDIPIVHPRADDCIGILLTPDGYAEEVAKEAGTWFMTPGWAELGKEMIYKAMHLDRLGIDKETADELAQELFAGYSRGLYIDTGVGDNEYFLEKARESCELFNIRLETVVAKSTILEDSLSKCREAVLKR